MRLQQPLGLWEGVAGRHHRNLSLCRLDHCYRRSDRRHHRRPSPSCPSSGILSYFDHLQTPSCCPYYLYLDRPVSSHRIRRL